ncbi:DUF1127 domain-containing protein [Roseiarcus sp.]|jgi:uncharacterized protein YjiS (DUF1127 family)|uniref:DUF1127 domain-containing protein n=1 Tax=Roseiarcus sp. TaxID=1969460 RepID=UPI003F9C2467
MITLKILSEKIHSWLRDQAAARELSRLSDHELCDIGVRRSDIENIVRHKVAPAEAGPRRRLPDREGRSPNRQPSKRCDPPRHSRTQSDGAAL